jgi:hypothetical protein
MAKRNITLEDILAVVHTGLTEESDVKAFTAFCESELGEIRKMSADGELSAFALKGKGDKAKGSYRGATVEFKGGHNAATMVIHFGCLMLKQAETLGILPVKADVSEICAAWKARRDRKNADAAKAAEADKKAESESVKA